MNRFSMLTQLREDINSGNVHGLNHNKPFLIGIIVHDNNDRNLTFYIQNKVEKWVEIIGDYFLLISFVAPRDNRSERKYTHKDSLYDKYSLIVDPYLDREQEIRANPLLRENLGLPQNGSFLVLSNVFFPNHFHSIPIDIESIEEELWAISFYCNYAVLCNCHTVENYVKLLNRLHASETLTFEPLLDLLIDFVSITSIQTKNDVDKNQLVHADRVIEKLKKKLKSYQGPDFEDRVFHLFEASETVVSLLYEYFNRDGNLGFKYYLKSIDSSIKSSEQKLDDYSKQLYMTYIMFSKMVEDSEEDIDYSGLTIYLGKIVENELHLSIGQMLRWSMDIDMPMYFNRYCSERHKVLVPAGNQVININKSSSDGRNKGIPMGTLISVYNTMINHPESINPQPNSSRLHRVDKELIAFIKDFSSKYRNKAGHLDPNSKNTYVGAKEKFNVFLTRFLGTLYNIRKQLQGS